MWDHVISRHPFLSRTCPLDETLGTGKWIVPIPLGRGDDLWGSLVKAACAGDIDALKCSPPRLDGVDRHHITCVY